MGVQSLPSWPILPLLLLSVLWLSSWPQPCQSPGTRETGSRIAPRENAPAQPRSPLSSAAQTSPCSSTTDTPRTVRKARSVTPLPPKEIRADLLLEEKRVMRGNKAVVENDTVSKINLKKTPPKKKKKKKKKK